MGNRAWSDANWLSSNLITLMAPPEPCCRFGPGFQKMVALTIQRKPVSVHLWEYDSHIWGDGTALQLIEFRPWSEINLESPWRDVPLEAVVISRCQPNTAGFLRLWRRLLIAQLSTRWSWPNVRGCLTRKQQIFMCWTHAEGWEVLGADTACTPERKGRWTLALALTCILVYLFSRYHAIVNIAILQSPIVEWMYRT